MNYPGFAGVLTASLIGLTFSTQTFANPALVGQRPPLVTLQDESGGKVDGSPWSSEMIAGKVWTLFYVDPDRKDINEALESALQAEKFPRDLYGSVAVINMEATWLPNAIIASSLASKQEQYPDTVYVKDLKKILVDKWKLKDDEYDVLVFDKKGQIRFSGSGEFKTADIKSVIETIKKHLNDPT